MAILINHYDAINAVNNIITARPMYTHFKPK